MHCLIGPIAFALIVSAAAINAAAAQSCDDDTIESISNDGAIIITNSGAVFRVDPSDRSDTAFWHRWDDVLICDGDTEIVDKDQNREHVGVKRVR
jgi:hypothetical protein